MNLVYQFHVPYKKNPSKGQAAAVYEKYIPNSVQNVRSYALKHGHAHRYHTKKYNKNTTRWVELDSVRIWQDPWFDQFENVAVMDVDMFFATEDDLFEAHGDALISMVHEKNFGSHRSCQWQWDKMASVVGTHDMPKSVLYPEDPFRFLNGGLQVWSKEARHRAREEWMDLDEYVRRGGIKEQKYVNSNIILNNWEVNELPNVWNCLHESWGDQPWDEIKLFHAGGTEPKIWVPQILEHIRSK